MVLERKLGESRWVRVARFRLGCEMSEGRYWEEKYKKGCRICGGKIESWEHVWEECREWEERGKKLTGNSRKDIRGGWGEGMVDEEGRKRGGNLKEGLRDVILKKREE